MAVRSSLSRLVPDADAFMRKRPDRPVVFQSSTNRGEASILDRSAVHRMLSHPLWRPPRLAMAKDGRLIDTTPTDGSASETLIMHGLHLSWPPIQAICASIASDLGIAVQANAYLTPPESCGYPLHSDPHSVLVFQAEGQKVWQVYSPVESVVSLAEREPDLQLTLQEGDVFFIPRGWVHRAYTKDSASLHVTFGLLEDVLLAN